MLRTTLGDGGSRGLCVSEAELCGDLWNRANRDADHLPRLRALLDELRPALKPWGKVEPTGFPVLTLRLRAADGRVLSFFSTFTVSARRWTSLWHH